MGIDALTDTELVALLVGTGIPGRGYKEVSNSVVRVLKDAVSLDDCTDDLIGLEGIGDVKLGRIIAGVELGRRLFDLNEPRLKIIDTESAAQYLSSLANLKQEHVKALYLNARFELVGEETLAIGTTNIAHLQPRDVLVHALEKNATGIVLAHNHPSGDSTPSQEDIKLTLRIRKGCDLLGISLLDHIVWAERGWQGIKI